MPVALVFETSTPHASIAIVGADGVLDCRGFCSDRNHNAMLFLPLEQLLSGSVRESIDLVLVGSGPGSYSGTRVGIAAAQGVAIALACPAVAVPSILAVPAADGGAACLVVGDARRGSFWTAGIENFRLGDGPGLCDAAGLLERVAAAVDEGIPVVSFEDSMRFPLPAELACQVTAATPDATRLWKVWEMTDDGTRRKWAAEIPQPIYLKPPHITPAKRPARVLPSGA